MVVDKWFHSFNQDSGLQWQGQVVERLEGGYYFVRLYEWIMGSPTCLKLVRLEDMLAWEFYESSDEMQDNFECRHKPNH
jgi:hypothetical protein